MSQDRDAFFLRNLEAIRQAQPRIAAVIEEVKPVTRLVWDEDGEPDLLLRDVPLYGQGATKYAKRPLNQEWEIPVRVVMPPIQPDTLDEPSGDFMQRLMRRAVDKGITFTSGQSDSTCYHLVLLGIGLGGHIDALVEKTDCRCVTLVEVNPEFLHQSLYTYDWAGLYERFREENRRIVILTGSHVGDLSSNVRAVLRNINPFSLDGLTLQVHYPNPILVELSQAILKDAGLVLVGFGFTEDETHMMANTHANLAYGDAKVYQDRSATRAPFPALVVGSGASLDACIDALRANAHKGLVISCGTALRPMMMAGIMPDVHVELERGEIRLDILRGVAQDHDLSGIWLVGSSTVWPEIRPLFKQSVYYFRPSLSSEPAFGLGPASQLPFPSPTVTNAALCFAQGLGCREIYFLGVDMGVKSHDKHHSQNAWQYTQNDEKVYREGWTTELDGNFGGTVYTNWVLHWARDELARAISYGPKGVRYFNCSDGAVIAGALPKLPKSLNLPDLPKPKADLVEQVMQGFPTYGRELFDQRWARCDLERRMEDVVVDYIDVLDRHKGRLHKRDYLSDMQVLSHPPSDPRNTATLMIRGTLAMCLTVGEYYAARVPADRRDEFHGMLSDELATLLEEMGKFAVTRTLEMIEGHREWLAAKGR